MKKDSRIFVAGHRGLAGSAILRKLQNEKYINILTATREELDLTNQYDVKKWFNFYQPEYVFLAAAKVGGIGANIKFQADFIRENLQIQTNIIDSAYNNKCKKLLFLGSSCIYPKFIQQPMKEEFLMSGELEPTNIGYSIAKIAGLIMCQKYKEQYNFDAISLMPTNLYGVNDNFNSNSGHVLASLIARFVNAKELELSDIVCWGDGSARREFLFADDLADASIYLMNNYFDSDIINIGTGKDISIKELAEIIKEKVGYTGQIIWDTTKPNGMLAKKLDVTKVNNLGWKAKTALEDGIKITLNWYLENRGIYEKI